MVLGVPYRVLHGLTPFSTCKLQFSRIITAETRRRRVKRKKYQQTLRLRISAIICGNQGFQTAPLTYYLTDSLTFLSSQP